MSGFGMKLNLGNEIRCNLSESRNPSVPEDVYIAAEWESPRSAAVMETLVITVEGAIWLCRSNSLIKIPATMHDVCIATGKTESIIRSEINAWKWRRLDNME